MFNHKFNLKTTIFSVIGVLMITTFAVAIFVPASTAADKTKSSVAEKISFEAITITVPISVECENTRPANSLRTDKVQETVSLGKSGGTFVSLTDRNYNLKQGEGMMLQMQYFCIGVKTKAFVPGEEELSFETATADYSVSDINVQDEDDLAKITGVITNNTAEDVTTDDSICVYAVFYDSEGDVIGLGYTIVDDVKAGGETCFEIGSYYEVEEYMG